MELVARQPRRRRGRGTHLPQIAEMVAGAGWQQVPRALMLISSLSTAAAAAATDASFAARASACLSKPSTSLLPPPPPKNEDLGGIEVDSFWIGKIAVDFLSAMACSNGAKIFELEIEVSNGLFVFSAIDGVFFNADG